MANSVDPGSTLFASILNSSVMLGNNLQQTTSADDIFRCIFFFALQGIKGVCTGSFDSIHSCSCQNATLEITCRGSNFFHIFKNLFYYSDIQMSGIRR